MALPREQLVREQGELLKTEQETLSLGEPPPEPVEQVPVEPQLGKNHCCQMQ